ncbi:potassium voltage-gated channel subfamily B member 2 isoform X2 [Eurytemora carolleeae]|uniref:potassium voltage-gated channel subfamily B member 2 isoform X2 n=1 Tax=Eurytemora carolleeae TaxID=1294199 RepID=UPI000C779704|nr:potassium voltage-gated channel subfamily B member 2 isoform X2 [Eurytemora carolleeae]|eukprot:XP_023319614.1 potassium voltage-gated channel subfamily B member 2-like isoform X2 [Eurytemora affinis]
MREKLMRTDEFRKLSVDKKSLELFMLLKENNRLLQETAENFNASLRSVSPSTVSVSSINSRHHHHVKKINNNQLKPPIYKKNSFSLHKEKLNETSENIPAWKTFLNINSDKHDPWINLILDLCGEDYFDRVRSLAKSKAETAIINVGGQRHEVTYSTLAKLPDTRLAKLRRAKTQQELNSLCDRYDGNNEYFFDRDPRSVAAIINFYRIGKLHRSQETCPIAFSEELTFWGISELFVEPCCQEAYYDRKDLMKQASKREEDDFFIFPNTCLGRTKQWWWYLFEYPNLTLRSRIVALVSFFFVLLSTVVLVVSTLLEDSNRDDPNYTNYTIEILEAIYMTWFTIEFLGRFLSCPDHYRFIQSFMNIIDLLAILPYYLSPLLNSLDSVKTVGQVLRILRIMRVFKMARHSRGLQGLGYTMKASYKELGLILMFVGIGILIFSALTYMSEKELASTKFTSVIDAFWWAAITMTTVGYGDVFPKTVVGRIVGSICAITGTLVIALPVPIVSENFSLFYKQERRRLMVSERRSALEKAQAEGRVRDYDGQNEEKAAKIIQERFRERTNYLLTQNSDKKGKGESYYIGSQKEVRINSVLCVGK